MPTRGYSGATARGEARVNGVTRAAGDGARVSDERGIIPPAGAATELLLFDPE